MNYLHILVLSHRHSSTLLFSSSSFSSKNSKTMHRINIVKFLMFLLHIWVVVSVILKLKSTYCNEGFCSSFLPFLFTVVFLFSSHPSQSTLLNLMSIHPVL